MARVFPIALGSNDTKRPVGCEDTTVTARLEGNEKVQSSWASFPISILLQFTMNVRGVICTVTVRRSTPGSANPSGTPTDTLVVAIASAFIVMFFERLSPGINVICGGSTLATDGSATVTGITMLRAPTRTLTSLKYPVESGTGAGGKNCIETVACTEAPSSNTVGPGKSNNAEGTNTTEEIESAKPSAEIRMEASPSPAKACR